MRLLNPHDWDMKDIISDDNVPPYAILSHTWEEEEISYQQWENRKANDISKLQGCKKIVEFGTLSAENGYDWIWVDTCCIDKKSNAELSEAINAMFRWYKNASVCYVYLADVPWHDDPTEFAAKFRDSRWFTRGWTLQELIAPNNVEFYSSEWRKIATKNESVALLFSITNIDVDILHGQRRPLRRWHRAQNVMGI